MSKTFRPWNVDQGWVLPPSLDDFVPAGHAAHVVRDTVREALDLSAIPGADKEDRGQPPYRPALLVALPPAWLVTTKRVSVPSGPVNRPGFAGGR